MYYLIPANTNKGKLIFNIFLPIDLIIISSGITVSFLSLLLFSPDSLFAAIICLLPALICGLLVIPIPHYHNVRVLFKELISFFYQRRNYKWEGWCYKDEFK